MNAKKKTGNANRDLASPDNAEEEPLLTGSNSESSDVTGILDERIHNLREAIDEIDAALVSRRSAEVDVPVRFRLLAGAEPSARDVELRALLQLECVPLARQR